MISPPQGVYQNRITHNKKTQIFIHDSIRLRIRDHRGKAIKDFPRLGSSDNCDVPNAINIQGKSVASQLSEGAELRITNYEKSENWE
jgi:hypothetical protein